MDNLILYNSPFLKQRIGKLNDGGYVIAILPDKYDLLISGGISNDISFEENLLNVSGFPPIPRLEPKFVFSNPEVILFCSISYIYITKEKHI